MTQKQRLNLAQWATEQAIKAGADQAAVTITNKRQVETQCRLKKIEKLKESVKNNLFLEIYTKNRHSTHSTCNLDKNNLADFVVRAVSATRYLAKSKYYSLPEKKYYPKQLETDLKISDPDYQKITTDQRKNIVIQIEDIAVKQSDKIISATADYDDTHYQTVKCHSNGFLGQVEGTEFSAHASVSVKDETSLPADSFYASARFYNDLPSPEIVAKNAVQRALSRIGHKKIESGRYDMIIENRATWRIIRMLKTPLSADALYQKQSFLDGMLNKKIASEKLTMIDDPFIKKGLGSRLFDNEALAAKKTTIIEKGILRNYYIDRYYGKKLHMKPTSGSTSNLVFVCGTKSLSQLIKSRQKAILVTGFIGGNSNPTTADFSYGIVGLLIENGNITQPVSSMNVSGNAKELLNSLIELGSDPYEYSSWQAPSMLFENVSFSGA